ncbi:MAG: HPr family phosphocarrier protein [Alphaproteobacteria bacterium]|nr:HPr family phosphocarrier protein [Emcibacter sp.]NOZ67583.1 HPr family phosphocarrier protein [Alphaproteobacteria bacterium]
MSAVDTAPETAPEIRIVTIRNERGLHARASAKFVGVAGEFDAEIMVSKDGTEVVGTSIMGLMMLAAAKGEQVTLKGSGNAAKAALDALEKLIEDKFGEE